MPLAQRPTEIQALRQCVRDLAALSALPAIWTHFDPSQIAESVAGALLSMLDLEFVCVSLRGHDDEAPIEVFCCKETIAGLASTLKPGLRDWLSDGRLARTGTVQNLIGPGPVAICSVPIGVSGEAVIVAASRRLDFPTDAQRLLLGVGANEAAIAIGRWRGEAVERRLAALAESSLDFIGVATLDGRPLYLNPAGLRIVGLRSLEDAARRHVLDFAMPEEQARMRDVLWPLVLKEGRWIGEIGFRHFATGAAIPFLVDWFRIDDPRTGRPMNISTVSRDLTEQKRYEANLRRLNETLEQRVAERTAELAETNRKLVTEMAERKRADGRLQELQAELFHAARLSTAGQMLATLAHEINQPLAAASNCISAARRLLGASGAGSSRALREALEDASSQVLRTGEIIRRLREFVTRGGGERRVENVVTMVEEAAALALAGCDDQKFKLTFNFDERASRCLADRIQVQQVLTNLVRNAYEAPPREQREIVITTALIDAKTVAVTVADNGPGLAGDVGGRLFEPFVTTKPNGMGLGLSISKSIVESHGGHLAGETRPGGGASFRFTLPAAPLHREAHGD